MMIPMRGSASRVTGVGRVVEQVFSGLQQSEGLRLRPVGATNRIWQSVIENESVVRWVREHLPHSYRAEGAFALRLASLSWAYRLEYDCSAHPIASANLFQRIVLALVRRWNKANLKLTISAENTDLFISTFFACPSGLDSRVPRLSFVYDLYPLRFPDNVTRHTASQLESLFDDLDAQRDHVIAISQYTKDDFCQWTGFPRERVTVVPLAASDLFRPIEAGECRGILDKYGIADSPFFLSVANPQPRKNTSIAIRAFCQFLKATHESDAQLLLVGDPSSGYAVDELLRELKQADGMQGRIQMIGGVEDQDLPAFYSAATAFLFPSKFEGFGLPVLEAMQCGTPVICSNATSIPEIVGDSAIQCRPDDEDAFCAAMLRVFQNPRVADDLRRAGLERAREFSWEKTVDVVKSLINRVIAESTAQRH
ncbi:Mannosylfructose-phosphate synthase [Rosistilla carotiformis]|uniref:Mannosylfructose-phosphate synthase n=2 Tax=Rosistilla carotiformis TaxID=2528017 RepID=A0A518JLD5_9BACT|nr:Mannosylfructose-phosphate synthase [Rosistilla carotiformis]